MKRMLALALAGLVMALALLLTGGQRRSASSDGVLALQKEDVNPWTHLGMPEEAVSFHFAVVADRTGAARPGVFNKAVDQLNLLRPAFVLSVGDLIEGYTEDEARINDQWHAFDGLVRKLRMPFFYVPGNHDLSNATQEKLWRERFGRRYYHFVHRDVLFLALNADDPPGAGGSLGSAQRDYLRRALSENQKVSWTIVLLHRPLWDQGDPGQNGWLTLENDLAHRRYTVFAGHEHRFRKFTRQGMSHYQLATTGGSSDLRGPRHGEFDHFAWVAMTREGPVVANVLIDGVLPDDPTAMPEPLKR